MGLPMVAGSARQAPFLVAPMTDRPGSPGAEGKAIEIAWERHDGEMYECRRRVLAVIECPRCGQDVECEAETEAWEQRRGKWHHQHYGPSQGVCCGLLLVDMWDGARAFSLNPAGKLPKGENV